MRVGNLLVGTVMALGTLIVLDASLPGGLIEGSGKMRYGEILAQWGAPGTPTQREPHFYRTDHLDQLAKNLLHLIK